MQGNTWQNLHRNNQKQLSKFYLIAMMIFVIFLNFLNFRSRWALQQDKLFFNGNMYAFNHVNETVIKVGKIE